MASIRARLTATYSAALTGTMLVFGAVLWVGRGAYEERDLTRYVRNNAEIAQRLIVQEATRADTSQRVQLVEIPNDTALGPQLVLRLRSLLAAIPDIVMVTDTSGRIVYQSMPAYLLLPDYKTAIARAADSLSDRYVAAKQYIERDTSNYYANYIRLLKLDTTGTDLITRVQFDRRFAPLKYVITGSSTKFVGRAQTELLGTMLVVAPFVLVVSIGVAYVMAGGTLRPLDSVRTELEAITDGRSLHRRLQVDSSGDELERLTATLNAMIERLQTSFGGLRRFTADASHELKTPLTVMRANVERAMSAPQGSSEQLVALEEALAEIARMADLVDSLLTLARFDEGRFDLHREPVSLAAIVHDVYETAMILGEPAELQISLPVCEEVSVLGDPARLRQLFLNLVTNAIKYTPSGGTVELVLRREGENVVFAVRDTGIGISAADLPHIFDRFWRADRARSRRVLGEGSAAERGGFGLGLAISQWIAQAHGGTLTVASRLTRGSTFTVTLPALAETTTVNALPSTPMAAAGSINEG